MNKGLKIFILAGEKSGDDVNGDGTQAKPYATPQRALYDLRNKFITQNGFLRCCLRWNTQCACGVSSTRGVMPRVSMA